MRNFLRCFSFIFLAACAHGPEHRGLSSVTESAAPRPLPISRQDIPNPAAIVGWQEVDGYQTSQVDVMALPAVPVNCADKNLYPTHPQQTTKLYHRFLSVRYAEAKLTAGDEACKIGSKYQNAAGRRPCLAADYGEYAVLSDTYQDACGNFYRAAWDIFFLKGNDNMGMLFSKGRTLYQRPDSDFPNDMYVAQTYPVPASDFLLISPLFPGDEQAIQIQRDGALKTHTYDPIHFIFTPKKM
jgi:hypothetical protein